MSRSMSLREILGKSKSSQSLYTNLTSEISGERESKTLAEIKKESEEKLRREIKIRTLKPDEMPLAAEAYYDPENDEIILSRSVVRKARLVDVAHEIGHKIHFDELKEKREPIPRKPESECSAWVKGRDLARQWGVENLYLKRWRDLQVFGLAGCYPPEDKPPCKPHEIAHKPTGEVIVSYTPKEFFKLQKEYAKTGIWPDPRVRCEE